MERADWNLLVLAAAKGQPLSPVQFQKSLFLLSRRLPSDVLGEPLYNFEPYNYGPFDAMVYTDAVRLSLVGLASVQASTRGWTEYSATPEGIAKADELVSQLPPDVVSYVERAVGWDTAQPFASLVQAVYRAYPEMKANSIFQF